MYRENIGSFMRDETGSLHIEVLHQKVEDVLKNGVGSLLGDSPAAKRVKAFGKKTKEAAFSSRGGLPDILFQETLQREFDIRTSAKEVEFALIDYRNALKDWYDVDNYDKLPPTVRNRLSQAIAGDKDVRNRLPDEIRDAIIKMRGVVDRLSREIEDSGLIEGEVSTLMGSEIDDLFYQTDLSVDRAELLGNDALMKHSARIEAYKQIREMLRNGEPNAAANAVDMLEKLGATNDAAKTLVHVIQNEGIYIHRAYRAFNDPNWIHDVPTNVKENFYNWLEREMDEAGTPIDRTEAKRRTEQILEEAKVNGNPMKFLATNLGAGRQALRHRKNLPDEYKALLGEYKDPDLNFAQTVRNMSMMLSNYQMQNNVRAIGVENGFFSYSDQEGRIPEDHTVSVIADGNESASNLPLQGLVTTPTIAAEFRKITETKAGEKQWHHAMYDFYLRVEGQSQRAKTSLSLPATVRQVFSNTLNGIANGYGMREQFRYAGATWHDAIKSKEGEKKFRDDILQGVKYGVIGESVEMNIVRDKQSRDLMTEAFEDAATYSRFGWVNKLMKHTDKADRIYAAMDSMFKMAAWEIEMERYAQVRGIDLSAEPTTDAEIVALEQLKKDTASIVRDTNPTYTMIPQFFKNLKRAPLGSFISYQTEIIRNEANRISLIRSELKDTQTQAIGARRLKGWLTARALPTSLAMATRFLFGISSEDEAATRKHVASFHQNSLLLFGPKDRNGKISYMDAGFVDPMGFAYKALNAIWYGESAHDKAVGALAEIVNPYLSFKLGTKYFMEAKVGYTETGRQIWRQSDSPYDRYYKSATYLFEKAFEPGTSVVMRKNAMAWWGRTSPGGMEYRRLNEALSSFGLRTFTLDPSQAMKRRAQQFGNYMRDYSGELTRTLNREGAMFPGEVKRAYNDMEANRRGEFERVQEYIAALKQLNPAADAEKILRDSGISAENAKGVIDDQYKPYIPSRIQHIDQILEVATPEHRVLLTEELDRRLESLAYAATNPATTERTAESSQRAIEKMNERGMKKAEVIEYLGSRFYEQDVASEIKRIKKLAKRKGIILTDEEYDTLARERVRTFKLTRSRRERLGRINWTRE
jgi:hypothetical protein